MYAFLYVFGFLDRENIYIHQMCTPPYMLTPPPEKKKSQTNVTLTKTLPIVYTEGYFLTYYGI